MGMDVAGGRGKGADTPCSCSCPHAAASPILSDTQCRCPISPRTAVSADDPPNTAS